MSRQINHEWIGKEVECQEVGCVPEFVGVVEKAFASSWDRKPFTYFHVRHPVTGKLWHRDEAETRLHVADVEVAA